MGFELLTNMVMCDCEPVCEFSRLNPTAAVTTADEADLPPVPVHPVTIRLNMPRKNVRRMRADFEQHEALIWRAIAQRFGWTTKRMRRMRKLSLLPARQFWVLEEIERIAAGSKA